MHCYDGVHEEDKCTHGQCQQRHHRAKVSFFVLAFAVCWVVKTLCHVGAGEIPNSNSVFYPLSPLSKDDANSRCVKFRGGGDDLQFRQPSAQRNGPGSLCWVPGACGVGSRNMPVLPLYGTSTPKIMRTPKRSSIKLGSFTKRTM